MQISDLANSLGPCASARFYITSPGHKLVKVPKFLLVMWLPTFAYLLFPFVNLAIAIIYPLGRCCSVFLAECFVLLWLFPSSLFFPLRTTRVSPRTPSTSYFCLVCFLCFCVYRIVLWTPPTELLPLKAAFIAVFSSCNSRTTLLPKWSLLQGILRNNKTRSSFSAIFWNPNPAVLLVLFNSITSIQWLGCKIKVECNRELRRRSGRDPLA